jgi:hypothetical protein
MLDCILKLVPQAEKKARDANGEDFSWEPTYEDGTDYMAIYMGKWVLSKISPAIYFRRGVANVEFHQIMPDKNRIRFVLRNIDSESALLSVFASVSHQCIDSEVAYFDFVRMTGSDPLGVAPSNEQIVDVIACRIEEQLKMNLIAPHAKC